MPNSKVTNMADETTHLTAGTRVAIFTVANPDILPYGMVRNGMRDTVVSDTMTGTTVMTFNRTARTWHFVTKGCCGDDDPVTGTFADITNFQVKDMKVMVNKVPMVKIVMTLRSRSEVHITTIGRFDAADHLELWKTYHQVHISTASVPPEVKQAMK